MIPLKRRSWRRRAIRWSIYLLIAAIFGVNAVAFMHARAMTHYVDGGARTVSPERLSLGGKLKVLLAGVDLPRPVNEITPIELMLDHAVGHVQNGDVTIETWTIPADTHRATIVVCHGYGESKQTMLSAAVGLHDLGCDVVLLDFRGCGGSTGTVTTLGYREAEDLAAVVKTIPRDRPVILYGQSMGAAAVLRAVGDLNVPCDGIVIESCFDSLSATVANRFKAMKLPPFPLANLLVFWGGVQTGIPAADFSPAESAKKVRCPALDLQGEDDLRVTPEQAKRVFDALAGPKTFASFPAVGHSSTRLSDPARWRTQVDRLIGIVVRRRTGED